jgi:hypothetical protein
VPNNSGLVICSHDQITDIFTKGLAKIKISSALGQAHYFSKSAELEGAVRTNEMEASSVDDNGERTKLLVELVEDCSVSYYCSHAIMNVL